MSQATINLQAGDLTLELSPDCGGSITALQLAEPSRTVGLLRPASPQAIATRNAADAACYPLVPFSNRIKDGHYGFGGRQFHMQPNLPGHPHPLHGHGWRAPWQLAEQDEHSAALVFEYAGPDFPSAYKARQRFELSSHELRVTLALENTGSDPMPCGVGLHPFFPKPQGTRLQAALRTVWLATDDVIPIVRVDTPQRWDFSRMRELGDVVLDHCFGGWNQSAVIEWPTLGLGLRIRAEGPMQHAVIYAPSGQSFFCFEPVTNANDVFNLASRGVADVGLQVLRPGQVLSAAVTFTVERLG
jgi:aldose 1-epimerase